MEKILEAKKINKTYMSGKENQQQVLKDIELTVQKGEFLAIMGQSGSGKSTLLYAISGMDRFDSGSVRFDGLDLAKQSEGVLSELRLTKMGFIFQQSNLLKNLTIKDNIMLASYLRNEESKKQIQQRADALMQATGIEQLADNDITQASGGQLQRASICRALINQPEILFGDEPTGALNSKASSEVMDILSEINQQGTTILLVTHDVKVAARTDRVVFMTDGVIAGEKRLEKIQAEKDNLQAREEQLMTWLTGLGF